MIRGTSRGVVGAIAAMLFVAASVIVVGCGGDDDAAAKTDSTTFEVKRGTLLSAMSAVGSISMPHQARLTFGSAGTVASISAAVGDYVKSGTVMAQLDVTQLKRDVTQAESNLRTAQINLDKAKQPPSLADIARAEATVVGAKATLAAAEEALATAKKPYSAADIAKAEAGVESARAALAAAEASLEEAKDPNSPASALTSASVEVARAARAAAENALEEAKNPYSQADIARAEAAVQSASAAVAAAENDLKDAQDYVVANAETAVRDAELAVQNAERSLTVAQKSSNTNVTDAQNAATDAEKAYNTFVFANASNLDKPTVAEQKDRLWWNVQKARESLEIARLQSASSLASAENNLTKAQANLRTAQENLARITSDPVAIRQKESQLAAARATLAKAQDDLAGMKADPIMVQQKESQAATATAAYHKAVEDLTKISADSVTVMQKESQAAAAKATLAKAEDDLADMKVDPVTVQQKESQVASAKAALAEAEENLADLKSSPDPNDIELKQIQLNNTQLSLDDIRERLRKASITAPFDGAVASIGADVGDSVAAGTVMILLVDTTTVEIEATANEIDVPRLKDGQTAAITLDAVSGAMLRGTVSAISPVSRRESGVVTYPIVIKVQNVASVDLREGMTASINIVTERKDNVLLVPSQAIRRNGPNRVVEVSTADGKTEERQVQVGSSDASRTEIVSGLEEGEHVLVSTASASSNNVMNQLRMLFGGGMQGGPQPGGVPGGGQIPRGR